MFKIFHAGATDAGGEFSGKIGKNTHDILFIPKKNPD